MSKFKIIELSGSKYAACIVIKTPESLYEIKQELNNKIKKKMINGKILIDTLFHAGNVKDRFIEIDVINGQINWSTVQIANIKKQDNIRIIIAQTLKRYPELINNSILTNVQKRLLSKGIGI